MVAWHRKKAIVIHSESLISHIVACQASCHLAAKTSNQHLSFSDSRGLCYALESGSSVAHVLANGFVTAVET